MRLHPAIPLALAAVALSGCTGSSPDPEPETTAAPTNTPESATSPAETAGPSTWNVTPEDGDPLAPGDEGPPAAQPGDAEAASGSATSAVTAYLTTEPPEAWWPTFSAHLTPITQEVWQYTDPTRIPSGSVTGAATVNDVTGTDAEITVPSTLGDFHVVLTRDATDGPWFVSYLEPPEADQP